MPYIITTTGAYVHPSKTGTIVTHESRRAVATLDEVHDAVSSAGADYRTMAHLDCVLDGTSALPVGPLPDGTVIEVTQVDWADLPPVAEARKRYPTGKPRDAVIRAFNALAS